ncbi:MAG: 4-alpha-glucanotransferase [Chitinophagaceae bacterium]|nr:4-alpha-glucanotransferase [Chitinophagaceae bacterium]
MKVYFYLRYTTRFGQTLWIAEKKKGNQQEDGLIPMNYLNDEFWTATVEIKRKKISEGFVYKYLLKTEHDTWFREPDFDKVLNDADKSVKEIVLIDNWCGNEVYENIFQTAPFNNVFFKQNEFEHQEAEEKNYTHIFRVKASLLKKDEVICLLGEGEKFRQWNTENPILLQKKKSSPWWECKINLSEARSPLAYKYGIYNVKEKKFLRYEEGTNRQLPAEASVGRLVICHDGFFRLPYGMWKGAGVAIPVFSLRTKKSFGVGEFSDLKKLADWASRCGFRMIQLLPVNDTSSTFTWTDSYPYSAISAFALHPIYINLSEVAGNRHTQLMKQLKSRQTELNALPEVDYESVLHIKIQALRQIYELDGKALLNSDEFKKFFKENKKWLPAYAVFCYLRDRYGTADYSAWGEHAEYKKKTVEKMCEPGSEEYEAVGFYFFVQYHLHTQLINAVQYARKKGVCLKGDIPIGVARFSCETWKQPELFHLNQQAGAPPDDFSDEGQNWGFPTYHWKQLQEDGFSWWKTRFEEMSRFFDAFRIDHILGFFRIWSIPTHAVQGILGRFVPALPVYADEFRKQGIYFDYERFCLPFITDEILHEIFGRQAGMVKEKFLKTEADGRYSLLPEFRTQKQVADFFSENKIAEDDHRLKYGLFELIANVLLLEDDEKKPGEFHFRISMHKTKSFKYLLPYVQERMMALYNDYFYKRQDRLWEKEALSKLPDLKEATRMMICGEDLGMIPDCVPDVMRKLGILSLEIQRMPKQLGQEFLSLQTIPYFSVTTPSTHDMSTLRSWWNENRWATQRYFNQVLGHAGEAPKECEPRIVREIISRHLNSPAMWAVFQIQDLLAMQENLRRENPDDERINIPANPKHYWRYRMHIFLEDLIKNKTFCEDLKNMIVESGRGSDVV